MSNKDLDFKQIGKFEIYRKTDAFKVVDKNNKKLFYFPIKIETIEAYNNSDENYFDKIFSEIQNINFKKNRKERRENKKYMKRMMKRFGLKIDKNTTTISSKALSELQDKIVEEMPKEEVNAIIKQANESLRDEIEKIAREGEYIGVTDEELREAIEKEKRNN